MAVLEVKVPQLSESVSEATLLHWHRLAGEAIRQDENLVDIETDKVVLELPAPANGVLTEIYKQDGATVVSGEVIALLDTEKVVAEAEKAVESLESIEMPQTMHNFPSETEIAEPPKVMPAAARFLAEHDMEISDLIPGAIGRITKQEVIAAMEEREEQEIRARKRLSSSIELQMNSLVDRPQNRVPMSRLRARIAERLVQSQMSNATLSTFNEVNMQPVLDLRRKFNEQFEREHGVRLGLMSFFVKAAVAALKKFPILNASIDGTDIVYHGFYDIGIAISSPRGLVVPIMRDADVMSIAGIEKKIAEFSIQARDGRLSLEDLTGGTFSISNGGVFGSMLSTPIINPPQSAILGIHATKDRPVVENGEIVIRPINYLALSYDHRLIDGREAVQALVTIKETLEDPARLLLDL